MPEERFRGEPRRRSRRILTLVGAVLIALILGGFWIATRAPSYLPPPGDEIDILLELAGVFPDKYGIMWREHGVLHSTDPGAQLDPALLRHALFMHNLTTGGEGSDGDIHVEVAYRFYQFDHEIDTRWSADQRLDGLTADEGQMVCWCPSHPQCTGTLAFGNYEFTLNVNYNTQQCANAIDPQREQEFRSSMLTADKLIALYLKPLRRKPSWL